MNKQQLAAKIWASANKMRSKIEANEYKDYILGFIFYKFLSDKEMEYAIRELEISETDLPIYLTEENKQTCDYFRENRGYFISYNHLFSTWLNKKKDFDISDVREALSAFARLIHPAHKKVFSNIFHTLDTGLSKLGATSNDQTKAVKDLIHLIKDIPMDGRQDYDVLGFIYEYLISQFAANAGKKAGEFYTPHEVSLLMAEIVAEHLKDRNQIEIFDPTSGSGSLLISIGKTVSKFISRKDAIKYYAQELKENTYNLTRMNLVMRGISSSNIVVRNGDTLERDWPFFEDEHPEDTYSALYVDAVVSNPPYSQVWEPANKKNDPRYADFGIAPKSKADYAFLLHELYHLKQDGIMTIVLPHGVLFRGEPNDGSEGQIRQTLIENNHLETVIGLPPNIFYGTGIPTLIMVLRKQRSDSDVLLIDASKGFIKEGKNNKLRASDIKRIVDTVKSRQSYPGFSRLVSKDLIRSNGYNLNLPRYIDSLEEAETWDIYASMFGGIPNSELDKLKDYWDALPGLRETLFVTDNTPYSQVRSHNVNPIILNHPAVHQYNNHFASAISDFDTYLFNELLAHPEAVALSIKEEEITTVIFARLADVALVDRYHAYQLLDDHWKVIASDLEIIQTEGMVACHVVDPNMVLKKKEGKEEEVQEGWIGRILPFELVQTNYLKEEYNALQEKQNNLSEVSAQIEELVGDLGSSEEGQKVLNDDNTAFVQKEVSNTLDEIYSSVETTETKALVQYLTLSKKVDKITFISTHNEIKWDAMVTSKDGTYGRKTVESYIRELRSQTQFPEDSYEAKVVLADKLMAEEKTLKSEIKQETWALHIRTKQTIENLLTDEQITELLRQKWIEPIVNGISALPGLIIDSLTGKVKNLITKYATTMLDTENQLASTERELCAMIDELTGNDYDMQGLEEFKKLLMGK